MIIFCENTHLGKTLDVQLGMSIFFIKNYIKKALKLLLQSLNVWETKI